MANINSEQLRNSWNSRRRPSNGLTLVAGYGPDKPPPFSEVLADLEASCKAVPDLSDWVKFYERDQVHATIVGLEGKRSGDSIAQDNVRSRNGGIGLCPSIDIRGFLDFWVQPVAEMSIAVGGFQENEVNPFDVRRKPFERSFDVRADGLLVAMGWPFTGSGFQPFLIGIRKYLETFNVVHKYHVRPQDQDNDLFFVIGEIDGERWQTASGTELAAAQASINKLVTNCRQALSRRRYSVSFALRDFQVVKYARTSLAEVSFARPVSEIDVSTFLNLYEPLA